MLLTVFTPTHDPQHLGRLAESLRRQSVQSFEWVIVPNGTVRADDISLRLPQIRVVPYRGATQNIGEIKRFCGAQSHGEILVEVDHDDELTPDALQHIADAFDVDPHPDFVYSNCCEVQDGQPWMYSSEFGWEYRPFRWNGTDLQECVSFDPCPASFSRIWYAPNHVRAWKRSFYEAVGGHDPTLAVLDDQDLICRSYLRGRVRKVDRCLYIYHVHPGNTCKGPVNAFIQEETLRLHDRYIYGLVERWCDLNGLRKIDLCGGLNSAAGYESIDLQRAHITADLNRRWPFDDEEVGLFRAHDALEHLHSPLFTMREAFRCLAPNGWLLTLTPSTDGRGAFQDPTHVSYWNSNSFWYYTRAEQARFIGTPVKFQLVRIKNYFPTPWHETHLIPYVKADLLKYSGRVPGPIEFPHHAPPDGQSHSAGNGELESVVPLL
ncbi:MAG: methyltransferase domain-containing protein [Planctomycetaceae bacterium]|nr:methyltransferase domain-containing protein [Planctomycetaceae bacterium]